MERGRFLDSSLFALPGPEKEKRTMDKDDNKKGPIPGETDEHGGTPKEARNRPLVVAPVRLWAERRWNDICLAAVFLGRVLTGVVAFWLIGLSCGVLLRWIDRMNVATRAKTVLSPFATTLPWIVAGILGFVILCIPGVFSEICLLIRRLKKAGGIEFAVNPLDNAKARERFVELARAVFKDELSKSKTSTDNPSAEAKEKSSKELKTAVAAVFEKWDSIDAKERNILMFHSRNIGADSVSQNVAINGTRFFFDGLFRCGVQQVFAEIKLVRTGVLSQEAISRVVESFRDARALLRGRESNRTSFHLLIGFNPDRPLKEGLVDRIRTDISSVPGCSLFVYPI